jgi:FlaG/FlaF family flagellin (archaellin)
MDRRGAAEIITTISLIALVLVLVGIVSLFVLNLVQSNIDETSACFGSVDKVIINDEYTCYNESTNEIQIAVEVKDFDLNSLGLGVYQQGRSKNFMINSSFSDSGLKEYGKNYGVAVAYPVPNSGITYLVNLTDLKFEGLANEVRITPVVNGINCGVSDTISNIKKC